MGRPGHARRAAPAPRPEGRGGKARQGNQLKYGRARFGVAWGKDEVPLRRSRGRSRGVRMLALLCSDCLRYFKGRTVMDSCCVEGAVMACWKSRFVKCWIT